MAGACICWPHLGGSRCQASRILAGAAETGARATGTASESVSNCSEETGFGPRSASRYCGCSCGIVERVRDDERSGRRRHEQSAGDQPVRPAGREAGRLPGGQAGGHPDQRRPVRDRRAGGAIGHSAVARGHDGARCRRARDGEPTRRPRKRGAGKARNPQRRSISRRRCGKTGRRRASQLPRALLRGRYRGSRSHAIPRLQPPRASLGRRERRRLAAADSHAHAQATQPRRSGELRRVTLSPPSPAAAQPARAPRPARDRA